MLIHAIRVFAVTIVLTGSNYPAQAQSYEALCAKKLQACHRACAGPRAFGDCKGTCDRANDKCLSTGKLCMPVSKRCY